MCAGSTEIDLLASGLPDCNTALVRIRGLSGNPVELGMLLKSSQYFFCLISFVLFLIFVSHINLSLSLNFVYYVTSLTLHFWFFVCTVGAIDEERTKISIALPDEGLGNLEPEVRNKKENWFFLDVCLDGTNFDESEEPNLHIK